MSSPQHKEDSPPPPPPPPQTDGGAELSSDPPPPPPPAKAVSSPPPSTASAPAMTEKQRFEAQRAAMEAKLKAAQQQQIEQRAEAERKRQEAKKEKAEKARALAEANASVPSEEDGSALKKQKTSAGEGQETSDLLAGDRIEATGDKRQDLQNAKNLASQKRQQMFNQMGFAGFGKSGRDPDTKVNSAEFKFSYM